MSEWTVVRAPGRRRRSARGETSAPRIRYTDRKLYDADSPAKDADSLAKDHVRSHIATLRRSAWWTTLRSAVETAIPAESSAKPAELVCFGLGSIYGSANARWQLACALLLRECLLDGQGPSDAPDADRSAPARDAVLPVRVFDPVLSADEHKLLQSEFYCEPISHNESGARGVSGEPDGITVFFMPHCPFSLYCNVLRANWGDDLSRLVIVGNSFSSYDERTVRTEERCALKQRRLGAPSRFATLLCDLCSCVSPLRQDPSNAVLRVLPYIREISCDPGQLQGQPQHVGEVPLSSDESAAIEQAFTDTSVMWCPHWLLAAAPAAMLAEPPPPRKPGGGRDEAK